MEEFIRYYAKPGEEDPNLFFIVEKTCLCLFHFCCTHASLIL